MTAGEGHTHAGGPNDGADRGGYSLDWFRVLDVVVWVAAALITAMGVEWFIGYLVREKIARGADKYLAKVGARKTATDPTE